MPREDQTAEATELLKHLLSLAPNGLKPATLGAMMAECLLNPNITANALHLALDKGLVRFNHDMVVELVKP